MTTRRFVGRVCLAMGMCLLLLALGTFQAHAYCDGNEACPDGGCVGSVPPGCEGRTCTGGGTLCWLCVCSENPIYPPKCNCTY